jgi:hypothetical protein
VGIESDQLVFDYLSRVGDLAQQQQLPSQARMRLVASLRGEIERRRGKSDTPDSVRRILTRLGTPDEVVAAASSGGGLAVPSQRTAASPESPAQAPAAPPAEPGGSPHLAGMDEIGSGDFQPDWWRVEDVPAGFHGGVEIPEMLKPPPKEEEAAEAAKAGKAGPPADAAPSRARRLLRFRARRGRKALAEAAPAVPPVAAAPVRARVSHPMLLLAAVLLVAGAVLGSWLPLAGGWLLAYGSRRLSPREAKWVVMGLPGLVAAAAVVWLWGRADGRWGEPIPAGGGGMSEALAGTWPWVIRGAAVASALYLAWRARRS